MSKSRLNWPAAYHFARSLDGGRLACLGRNVVVIDLVARTRVSTSHPVSHPSWCMFSPDGRSLAVKATSGRIVVLDPTSGEIQLDHANQKEGEGGAPCFSPDGDELVDGSWEGVLTVRPAHRRAITKREHYPGEMIARVTQDTTRRMWLVEHCPKVTPGQNLPRPGYVSFREWPFEPETTRVHNLGMHIGSASLSPDGSRFCFLEKGHVARLHIARTSDGRIIATSAAIDIGGTGSELAWSNDCLHVGSVQSRKFVFYHSTDLAVTGVIPMQYPSSLLFMPTDEDVVLGSWVTSAVLKLSDALAGGVASTVLN